MDLKKLKEQWLSEENMVFKGWDFSYLDSRWHHESLSWDYDKLVREYKQDSDMLLDMGTGGGEYLLTLNHPYRQTFITEGYLPNIKLCNATLSPLGITVKQVFDDDKLPFNDELFDIVINRHESFDISEVYRVLKPSGVFITQQVGGNNNVDLSNAILPGFVSQYPTHTLEHSVNAIKSQSFDILFQKEAFPTTRFYDIGAVVYYAKAIEWEFPNFSVEKCFPQLCDMQNRLQEKGCIESLEHRFVIIARKNNPK